MCSCFNRIYCKQRRHRWTTGTNTPCLWNRHVVNTDCQLEIGGRLLLFCSFLETIEKVTQLFFNATFTIYPRFLINKPCLQHGAFTNMACTWSKDSASGVLRLRYSIGCLDMFTIFKGTVLRDFWPLVFFRQSITPRPQMNTLKYFQILFRIRWEIYENVLIPRYAA
jgi:hypothetical protein